MKEFFLRFSYHDTQNVQKSDLEKMSRWMCVFVCMLKLQKIQASVSPKLLGLSSWNFVCTLRGTTSLTAWKRVIFVNLKKKKYSIECFKILQIYLCINNEYEVIFSDENIRFSASYPPSPESSKKKVLPLLQLL